MATSGACREAAAASPDYRENTSWKRVEGKQGKKHGLDLPMYVGASRSLGSRAGKDMSSNVSGEKKRKSAWQPACIISSPGTN